MQKLIETLKGFGIEVPEDKHTEVKKALSAHYKNVAEHDKAISRLETDRDGWKQRAETAEETLKGFEGKDFETITKERDEWKKKAEEAKTEYDAKISAREKEDLLKEAFADVKFTSESAKKAIMAQISDGVTVKNGKLIGFNDLLEEAKKSDASAFADETAQKLEDNRAKFTNPATVAKNEPKLTKQDIMAIRDSEERQVKIAQNMHLFKKE